MCDVVGDQYGGAPKSDIVFFPKIHFPLMEICHENVAGIYNSNNNTGKW
jgi:hypothetical protein